MLVNNAGTLHWIHVETPSSILPHITFCVPVTLEKNVAGVNKHWVMLNTVLCKSLQSCVLLWPGMQGVGAVPCSCM